MFTLKQLADEGDLTAVQQYLKKYVSALPETEIIYFCKNHAVNALLNYYAQLAEQNGIELDWHTDIPETIGIVKKCAVGEYPKSWIGRSQAA